MAYRKTKETEERKETKRRLILDVATKLFGNGGYHATTVPMILAGADISSGCFYTYFRNKEDVFNAALEDLGRAIVCVIDNVNQSQSDPLKRIPQGAKALFLFLAENPEQARILIVDSSGLSPRIEKTRRSILLELEVRLLRVFESKPSLFSVQNATITARCIAGATFEAAYCWLEEDPKTRMQATEVARAVAHFNTRAVKKVLAKCK